MKPFRRATRGACILALACLSTGCRKPTPQPEPPPAWFEDVTEAAGLDFTHDAGPADGSYFMPQIVGSGAALFDFDGDGLLDVYLLNNGGPRGRPNRLYKQLPGGRFRDVGKGSGLDFSAYCMGVAVGDVNNDGRPDVLVTEFRGVRLFLNNGDGTFTDATASAGLVNPGWGTSAAFFDYDRDGWLDLVVVNYLEYDPARHCTSADGRRDYCSPQTFPGTVARLYRNLGRAAGGKVPPVRFADVTAASGFAGRPGPGLGVVCADLTGDGWPDVLVANDGKPNHLWVNQRNGTFREEAVLRGLALNAMGQAEANMGIGWGDVDGDGLEDVFVTHIYYETNTLWKQGPRGIFQDQTRPAGLHRTVARSTGFGTVLADFDNDGSLDLAITNGGVARAPAGTRPGGGGYWGPYVERNQLFANDGAGRFRERAAGDGGPSGFCGAVQIGRGLAAGDVANDGSVWLLSTAVAGRARLYRNVAAGRGHWLVVRAYDPATRRDAVGAEVVVRAGGRSWVRTVHAGGSYLCSNDPRAHFGLGKVDRVDSIQVRWPDGSEERFTPAGVDRRLELHKGKGRAAGAGRPGS